MAIDFSGLDELIARRLDELNVPSISVGVSIDGETAYERSFGFADMETQRLATPETPYPVASVSKPVLGTALAIMLEEGKIGLHEPVNRYLSGARLRALEGCPDEATIARLANHTSGLPTHYQFFTDGHLPVPSGEETILHYGNLTRPAGEASVYANLGFGFLGTAIENQSGICLREFFKSRIFEPLGMSSSFLLRDPVHPDGAALRYEEPGKPFPPYVTDHPGASDVYTSVRDLLKFGQSHFGHRSSPILEQETILAMHEPTGPNPIEQSFGITWVRRRTVSGELVIAHSGGMAGVVTRLVVIPARSMVVVVLSNFESTLVEEAMTELYKTVGVEIVGSSETAIPTPMPKGAVGTWRGQVMTYAGDVPIGLVVKEDGSVAFEGSESDAKFESGQIIGTAEAKLPTPDAQKIDHHLALDLQYRGNCLTGSVAALTLESVRLRNRIAYPARLVRV